MGGVGDIGEGAAAALLLLLQVASGLDLSQCIGPLGMQAGSIKDSALSASTSYEDTVGPQYARVRVDINGGAWCPKDAVDQAALDWLQIDLGTVHALSATESQGRFGNGDGAEFAEAYLLEYWRPRLNKWVRYRSRNGQEVISANSNTYVPVKNELDPVILASKIRFHPYNYIKRTTCMRVEVYGCPWNDGLLAYNMPQGDRRGSAYEFYDWTYDGEWIGNMLRNGLGCLTDGDYGPANFKLSYYAQNRGWVGWKHSPGREFVELEFQFDQVREFHAINVYVNNQFEREVSVFERMLVLFSVSDKQFDLDDSVEFVHMEDTVIEDPRNVTAKLHRRVAKFVRVRLYFAGKWIMISEVSFDSSVARGNYTDDVLSERELDYGRNVLEEEDAMQSPNQVSSDEVSLKMPVVVGVLLAVILLLAAIIFFIVNRSRRRKWLSGGISMAGGSNMEEATKVPFQFTGDTNSSDCSRTAVALLLDSNYNKASSRPLLSGSIRSTPQSGRKSATAGPPRLQVPPPPPPLPPAEGLYTEPANYVEPYKAMRYSPYYGYGPVLSEIEDSLMKQSLLSDAGDYAVPLPRSSTQVRSPRKEKKRQRRKTNVAEESSSDNTGKVSSSSSSTLDAMRARLETHMVPEICADRLSLRQRLSEGAFGTVYVADAFGLPDYGGTEGKEKTLVAVKFLSESATQQEKSEFVREVRLLSVLEDANISRVLGMCSRQEPLLVTMEYLEHGDLNQFLRCHLPEGTKPPLLPGTRTLSFDTLIYLASQVSSGMRYLESLNFVHRDLATRNCLVGKAYHLKICDFGSDNPLYARDYYEMESHLLIPLRWMAWESVLMCKYTTKSDVWSFGVCLWEILQLASVRPFASMSDEQVLERLGSLEHSSADNKEEEEEEEEEEEDNALGPGLERPLGCPRDLYELMCECWKRDAASRPSFREIHLFLQRKNLCYSPI